MKQLLSVLVAALFAAVSMTAIAQDKGKEKAKDKGKATEMKDAKGKDAKAKDAKAKDAKDKAKGK